MKKLVVYGMCILFVLCLSGCMKGKERAKEARPGESKQDSVKGENTEMQPQEVVSKEDKKETGEVAVIETRFGKITIRFFPEDAPNHVENFKKLAKQGFYDGTIFHRVIPGFMIQGGDPNTKDDDRSNDGMGNPGYTIKAEFNERSHQRGIVSMARSSHPDSAGSQFFICVAPATFLDGKYTVFGEVIEGLNVADKIVNAPRDSRDNPLEKIPMTLSIIQQ